VGVIGVIGGVVVVVVWYVLCSSSEDYEGERRAEKRGNGENI
jgi:hypothetical protein